MDQPTPTTASQGPADRAGRAAEDAWAAAAADVLRRAGRLAEDAPDDLVWERLARDSVEGLPIPPLGTPSRAAGLPAAAALGPTPGRAPFVRGSTARRPGGWDVRAHLADPDPAAAHRSALADLEGGVTSLWVRIGEGGTDARDLAAVLDGVHLDMAPLVLGAAHPELQLDAVDALADLAGSRAAPLHPDSNLGADPIGAVARDVLLAARDSGGGTPHEGVVSDQHLRELHSRASDLGVRAIVVDGTVAHEAGAGDAGEVGYTLAVGAAYLRALTDAGMEVDTACGLVDFRYAATDDQFLSIAKLRAARLAWHRVAELSGATPRARAQRQHAVTSRAMLTRYDPWVNLLRTTVAAFAAAVGGATAVTVLPFDAALGIPDEFGRRMARNISALLIGESNLAAVTDPAGGAHAVEMLTADLAEAAWAEFGRIEKSGGILTALADGTLAERIGAVRRERQRRIATRRRPITGVSEFPAAGERLPKRRPAETDPVDRWAAPFERLRDRPVTGSVLILTVGTQASASSRTLFTRSLLAAGGIPVAEPAPGASIEQALADTGCHTVMLAGSDSAYQTDAAALARRARAAGARAVFLAGRPRAILAELPDALIDGTVAAGDDVLEFLHTVRATLGGEVR